MFPPVPGIPKHTAETSVFNVSSADTGDFKTREMVVPANTNLYLHATSVHFDGRNHPAFFSPLKRDYYAERYYPDPYSFKPDRFMTDSWNKDMFLAFSSGARCVNFPPCACPHPYLIKHQLRACVGRK